MTVVRDDCFVTDERMIPYAEGLGVLMARIAPVVGRETVALGAALGRVLCADVVSGRDVPAFDNSAVDGYAVAYGDLTPNGQTRLEVAGRIAAGHPLDGAVQKGAAYRIFTGAPVPAGLDTVFMQEDVIQDGDGVILPAGVRRGANFRHLGEDVRRGETVLAPGRRLRPQDVGLAASLGCAELPVYTRLKAAIFSTGDEVREPGGDAPEGCLFDINRYSVSGLLTEIGVAVTDLGILPDDPDAIVQALDRASVDHDVILTSGGVSVGDEDHVKGAVNRLGSLHFWRLAIKPGRPIAFGRIKNATFIGLPGNPVASMVTFMCVARAVILRLAGRVAETPPRRFPVRADFAYKKKTGRREWLRAWLTVDGDGRLCAVKFPSEGSGVLTSMVKAEGLVELEEDRGPVAHGDRVAFIPFSEVRL
ncbi:molybdopterin molybdotransferase MoeA [Varunaivibrio sulfuroxidans]|uniref:Molybdopterin molybdenumtransferase n=1 Tax=Varunaivibrio sulfuroxidans TaxID=1773489 RepID=A0A4R3J6D4_9PROT|nr:gephyrin-like molybdotransferase Glp [Varunaivibrio sulfuroxidans]TCS60884.1 molybdopterin molybdochelatase [Varunaivibrio sulfuroxidans]WES31707.1 molybdopterin molybdotransferase MoeA [Varunaivibrio sulfuroxidans]